jgi:FkbM family methyltransferase
MPATRLQRQRVAFRANLPWRRLMPSRTVHRHVQGVDLYLPWAHLLPDFAKMRPWYGQNLVELAAALEQRMDEGAPFRVLDIGANIGDSAAQIIARTNARVLCVEADPYWADYLRKNLGTDARAEIEEVLLTPDDSSWGASSPVRTAGTTTFTQDADKLGALPPLSVTALRQKHADFARMRLVKSDTDGFDTLLVPAVAETWKDEGPVLFFEYDPTLTIAAGDATPEGVWQKLADFGYSDLIVWDNTGDPLGRLPIGRALEEAKVLMPRPTHLGYDFWDVAACRSDDTAALAAFAELVPEEYSVRGTWR